MGSCRFALRPPVGSHLRYSLDLRFDASFLRPIIEKVSDDESAYVSITRYD